MKKPLLILLVLLSLFAGAAPGVAAPRHGGFLLAGADAAYVDFSGDDGCNVFVGYVWARFVKYFDTGQLVRPHSDLEVKLTGSCDGIEGLVPTVGDTRAGIVKLKSAYVDNIVVPLGGELEAVVDLTWTATGPIFIERFREPGMRALHRTRLADVVGTVTITDGTTLLRVDGDDVVPGARITHFTEIQWSGLP